MVLYYCDLLFGLYPSSLCSATTAFWEMVLPPIEASSIDWTQQRVVHLITREEPSLETLWLQNIRMMDKVQIIDRTNLCRKLFWYLVLLPDFYKLWYLSSKRENKNYLYFTSQFSFSVPVLYYILYVQKQCSEKY
jgi:hypothetical protein